MSENPPTKKLPLNDPNYFTYFKAEKDGWIYDEFCKLWEDFAINDFDGITHYNTLQVYKFMIEKRIKHIAEIKRISAVSKEKDKKIENMEREKSEAIQNVSKENAENIKLKARIRELEALWNWQTRNDNGEEVAELKNQLENLKANAQDKEKLSQRYRKERDSAESELQKADEKLQKADDESKALKNVTEKLKADLNAAKNSVQQLQTQNEKLQRIQNEINQLKDDFKAKDMELGDIKRQYEWTKEELKEYKEQCRSFEEEINQSQIIQIEVQQLQQALNCSTEQIQKLEAELSEAQIATNEVNDRKMMALHELTKSVKDCGILKKMVTKASPSRKELIERIKTVENENQLLSEKNDGYQASANDISFQYQKMFNENRQLKIDLENALKRREKLDKIAEKRRKSKEHQEIMQQQQQQNGEGSSKRARHEMPPTSLNIFPTTAQQYNHDPVSCSPPTIISPPGLSPQTLGHGQPSPGLQQTCPELYNRLIRPPPNSNLPFQNFLSPQQQQQFWRHQQQQMMMMMSQQRFTSNYSRNPLNNPQQQQQLPSPNAIPEMLPPSLQQQNQEIPQIFFRNFHQQHQQQQQQRRIPLNFPSPSIPQSNIQQQQQQNNFH